ncbi:MAG: DUF6285 domain-containing protein [Ilumatobacter sp.]|uniref:DUF6285 domain-containing protein n=1 Tax=Ilumatobacter sp. TaxID=1967498 RepID=UPI00260A1D3E|nr:DUF6285 domain-containing protein [Ilumatobacter sp.]MDJ0770404.1 DUF6285 domain-containing protein [Ilumatobacter sp.]
MEPHDAPSAAELLEAVREWLEGGFANGLTPSPFHARVAANMLAIVERELSLGPEQAVRHRERLGRFGVADDADLAARIRSGQLDDRFDEVRELVWASVRDKLAVANPRYLERREETA